MAMYVKPNGTEIDVHEKSEEYAKSLGWKPKTEKKTTTPRKSTKKSD